MRDESCVQFLQWALPRLHMRWPGFRKVRRQACRKIQRRIGELGLEDVHLYRDYLEANPEEWRVLDTLVRITISRFFRDRAVFDFLGQDVLPALLGNLKTNEPLRCWSAGCASGEEPYSLAMMWLLWIREACPGKRIDILATDVDPDLLDRARAGLYQKSVLRRVPDSWLGEAFTVEKKFFRLKPEFRNTVRFALHDVRSDPPPGPFHVIFCRNLAFTYFDGDLQESVLRKFVSVLSVKGVLVLGSHEIPPAACNGFSRLHPHLPVFRKN